jgi:hypothetical protein
MSGLDDTSVKPTLRQFDAALENTSPDWERTINGNKPKKRWKDLRDRRAQALRAEQVRRYTGLHEVATQKINDADETLDLLEEQIDKWFKALKAMRLGPDEGMSNVKASTPVVQSCIRDYESAAKDAEAATEFIDQPVEDFEEDQLARFPSLRQSLPVVTNAWLAGEPGAADPLAAPPEPGA